MENQKYYQGNYREDAATGGGWFIGYFIINSNIRRTENIEIKYWEFKKGEKINHLPKVMRSATEYTLVIKGKMRGRIEDRIVILKEGEYVVIRPGVVNNLSEEFLEDTAGITIKAPSIKGDKIEIKKEFFI